MALRLMLLSGAMALASCASTIDQTAERSPPTATPADTTAESVDAAGADTPAPPDRETTIVTEPSTDLALECSTITNFDDAVANDQWLVVNDDVMGGRSLGGRTFADNLMVFAGSTNTDGGGFSSIRLPLVRGAFSSADRVVLRARADSRRYAITSADALEERGRRVSFRAPMSFQNPGEWETITVVFSDLVPVINGRLVVSAPFRPDLATRVGVIVSDGADGEFMLEIDSIQVCAPVGE